MKRTIITVLLVLSVTFLIALESPPSETVGFFKLSVNSGSFIAISEPFMPLDLDSGGDMDLIEVLGTQWGNFDKCYDMQTGSIGTFLTSSNTWVGALAMVPYDLSHTYWIERNSGNPDFDFYLVGEVNPATVTYAIGADGYTAFGLNECSVIALADLGFPAGELQNLDKIYDMQNGEIATYLTSSSSWVGVLNGTGITPTHTYWLETTSGTGFSWTYTPAAPPLRKSITKKTDFSKTKK